MVSGRGSKQLKLQALLIILKELFPTKSKSKVILSKADYKITQYQQEPGTFPSSLISLL